MSKRLDEIKNKYGYHLYLLPINEELWGDVQYLITKVEKLEAALKKCDPSLHPVFVCNQIRKEALEET